MEAYADRFRPQFKRTRQAEWAEGLLTPAAKLSPGCRDVGKPVPSLIWQIGGGDRGLSQVPREPFCTSALPSEPGRTLTRDVGRSGAAPVDIRTKAPAIWIFRGSITRLLCSLPTLKAVLSGDSPRPVSGRLPPFSGRAFFRPRFLQRNFHIRLRHCFLSFWALLGAICPIRHKLESLPSSIMSVL